MNLVSKNNIIRGSYGALWVNENLLAEVKSFEAKVTLNYEEVSIAQELGTHNRYMGFNGEGTMVLHKVDSFLAGLLVDGIKSGEMPDIKMVGKLEDPTALGAERVELIEVTFDELTLLKFENKTILEQEAPFKFADFNTIDLIQ